jgi:hypothetical protein
MAIWQPIKRLSGAAFVCVLAAAVAGCSTVSGLGDLPRPGYQKDGSYVLSSQEQIAGCRELQERKVGLQQQLEALPAQAVKQMQELPKTVADAWGRLVGSSNQGVPALAEYNEAKAETAALNESMSRKGCAGPSVETAAIKH